CLSAPRCYSSFLSEVWVVPSPPTVTLSSSPACHHPGINVTLICTVSNYYPEGIHVTWLAGGKAHKDSQSGQPQKKGGQFHINSTLSVSPQEWDKLGQFTCQVNHPGTNSTENRTISKCTACQGSTPQPSLYLLKPLLQELFNEGQAHLTCLVVGYELDQANIIWEVDGVDYTKNATTEKTKEHSNLTQSLQSRLVIPQATWDSRKEVLCRVTHPCSLFQMEKKTVQKSKGEEIARGLGC
uniref:Ig-like domain-containing protein n=2 Tax=Sphenodon punctatus TaxID=8508 RepID=A0A8D0L1J1_SPHPU